jgi:hypothetical protein
MAFIPDIAIENFHLLTPAEIKVFSFYCKRRNRHSGGWQCADAFVADKMKISKNRVSEARVALQKKGWIKCLENHFVAPLMGFSVVENSTDLVENSTALVENSIDTVEFSTNLVENSTSPLKESYQPIIPTHLTSYSAEDSLLANSANTPADKNFVPKNSPPLPVGFLGESQPAGRPTLRVASAGKPAERRRNHPAVEMVKKITGRFPPKDQWDKIIREVGDSPDAEFFRSAWEIWRSFDGKPTNLQGWLFQPNAKGKLPEVFGSESVSANGQKTNLVAFEKHKPIPVPDREVVAVAAAEEEAAETERDFCEVEPLSDRTRESSLVILRGMLRSTTIEGLKPFSVNYLPEDWAWLLEQLKNR